MILFAILSLICLFLVGFTILATSVVGAVGIVIFADVIVCILLIVWIIKKLSKKRQALGASALFAFTSQILQLVLWKNNHSLVVKHP